MILGYMFNKIYNMFLDTVDKLQQYRLFLMLSFHLMPFSNDVVCIADLHKINLLSQNEVKIIKYTDGKTYRRILLVMMVSDNIMNGDKNDFSKLSTYLKTLPEIKHLVQYFDRQCMLSLVDTKVIFQIYKLARSKKLLCVNLILS